jgi:transposase-like protein
VKNAIFCDFQLRNFLLQSSAIASSNPLKGYEFNKYIIIQAIFWYCRYSLSYRNIEELMDERGVEVDYSTIQRWVEVFITLIEEQARKRKKSVNRYGGGMKPILK